MIGMDSNAMTRKFVPWSIRSDPEKRTSYREVLYEGVPPHLRESLIDFLREAFHDESDPFGREFVSRATLMSVERQLELILPWDEGDAEDIFETLLARARTDEQLMLDLVDQRVHRLEWPRDEGLVLKLHVALHQAGSAWTIEPIDHEEDPEAARFEMVRRVDSTVNSAVMAATERDRAGQHLQAAWRAAYGRKPDPGKAFAEAVKAAEVAVTTVVTPRDPLGTLGRAIGEMKSHPDRFRVRLQGVGDSQRGSERDLDAVAITRLMVQLLWRSQLDRHGAASPDAPISVTQNEAEAAVHLAVLLVQWFTTGVVERTSAPDLDMQSSS